MDNILIRINRKSIADRERVEKQISRSQDKLLVLHRKQMDFYEKEQKIMEVS